MARSTVSDAQAALKALAHDYEIAEENEILAFFERYSSVPPLLPDIRAAIRRFFEDDPVKLEIFYDPECGHEPPMLIVNIQTQFRALDALDRLEEFDRGWWLEKLEATDAPVLVSIEHVRRV